MARLRGAAAMAAVGVGAGLVYLAGAAEPSWRVARESLPLAAAVGAATGAWAFSRVPASALDGARIGLLGASAGLGLFLIAYATADAAIAAVGFGASPGAAWASAAGRVLSALWAAGPAALIGGACAGAVLGRRG